MELEQVGVRWLENVVYGRKAHKLLDKFDDNQITNEPTNQIDVTEPCSQLVKQFPHFTVRIGSVPSWQAPAACPYLEPD